jgi:hypothetical protein
MGADGNYVPNTSVTVNNPQNFYIGTYRTVATNFLTSAASWRLRELSIAYDLPTSLIGRQNIVKGVSVALTGRNLFLWLPETNDYTDPDFNFTTGNTAGVTNSSINPPTRIFGGSVSVTF